MVLERNKKIIAQKLIYFLREFKQSLKEKNRFFVQQ